MAVRPVPPGIDTPPPPAATSGSPQKSRPPVPTAKQPKSAGAPAPSQARSGVLARPLPTPPPAKNPEPPHAPPQPPVEVAPEPKHATSETDSSSSSDAGLRRPTPERSASPGSDSKSSRPQRPTMARTPSEILAKKANILSAAFARATLRSSSLSTADGSRSSSFDSQSSDDSAIDEMRTRMDAKRASDKEAKRKDKEESKKDKKSDDKRRTVSVAATSPPQMMATFGDSPTPPPPKSKVHKLLAFGDDPASSSGAQAQSGSGASVSPSNSGTPEPRKNALPKPKKPKQYVQENAANYSQLIDLLTRNSFLLMRAIEPYVKRSDLERVSKEFLSFFAWREVTLDYIKSCIRQEVDHAESEGTLFRTNSIFTAIMSGYCQRIGKQYLKSVLGPSVQWLEESTLSFEIDPAAVDNPDEIKPNIFNMNYLANKFFKAVLNSIETVPFEVREIANSLQTAVLKRFPASKNTAVGGFFFLRFVCPAVLAPENFDFVLSEERSAELRRPLVLVAKILQQIANDQKFNEPHMEPLNELIAKWSVKVHQFFDLLVQKDLAALNKERSRVREQQKDADELERTILDRIDLGSLLNIHRLVASHVEDLVTKYADKEKELGYNPASELAELFDTMGPVPENNKIRTTSVAAGKKDKSSVH